MVHVFTVTTYMTCFAAGVDNNLLRQQTQQSSACSTTSPTKTTTLSSTFPHRPSTLPIYPLNPPHYPPSQQYTLQLFNQRTVQYSSILADTPPRFACKPCQSHFFTFQISPQNTEIKNVNQGICFRERDTGKCFL